MLEAECHLLDELAQKTRGETGDKEGFITYSRTIHEIHNLEEEKERKVQYANTLDGVCTAMAVQCGHMSSLILNLRQEAVKTRDTIDAIVSLIFSSGRLHYVHVISYSQEKSITEKNRQCQQGFDMDEGPFCQALDKALASLKVHREAYYGGTFTGNHAHKCLKV